MQVQRTEDARERRERAERVRRIREERERWGIVCVCISSLKPHPHVMKMVSLHWVCCGIYFCHIADHSFLLGWLPCKRPKVEVK